MTHENGHDTMAAAMRSAGYQPVQGLDGSMLKTALDTATRLEQENAALWRRVRSLQADLANLTIEHGKRGAMDALLELIAAKHEVLPLVMKGNGRTQELSKPRCEFYWRAYHELGKSLPEIGRFMGRHHTTVLVGRDKHKARIEAGEAPS